MKAFNRIFGRRRRYEDLCVSIREHLEERTDELMEDGLSREGAEQQARRELGNPIVIEERSREEWQWQPVESIFTDLKLSLRRLRRSPGFAATVLLTLAIGIGANTAVFSVINNVLLKPLPYPDSGRLAALWLSAPGAGGLASFSNGLQLSPSMYFTFSRYSRSFESMGIWTLQRANVTGLDQPEEVRTALVSDGVLQAIDVPPLMGRWLTQADQDPRGARTVILGYGYWQRKFGVDHNVIGRTIQVDAQALEIVGVMPRGFRMVDKDFDLLIPLALDPVHQKMSPFGYDGIARLKPGISFTQADADVARLIPVWMDSWSNGPGTNPHYYERWRITPNFHSLKQQVIGNVGRVLWVVMATVGLVMLIVCTNLANLLLVRAESRQHELAIRAALGAGRGRIARELLVESIVLGLTGGIFAIGTAWAGLRLLVVVGPGDLPRLTEIALDGRSQAFTLLLALFSGLFFGSIPAWKYSRSRLSLTIGGTSRTVSAGRTRQSSRRVLVVAQVAMALVLMVSALLMIRTFMALRDVEPGFTDPAHIQTMRISIPDSLIADPQMVTRTQKDIADKIAAIPGVSSVGFAAALPMEGIDPNWDQILVEGRAYEGVEPPLQLFNYVSPGYLHAMGTRFVAGRDFTWTDIYGLRPKVIISDNFARASWGSATAAIGKRVRQFVTTPWEEVIGVVEDVHHFGVDEKAPTAIYWPTMIKNPYSPEPAIATERSVAFAISSSRAGNEGLLSQMQQAVWSVNASLPVASTRTMQDIYSHSMARTSFTLAMLAIAGTMALALSIIGIYGVISYAVLQRTREIGIRLSLGAPKTELSWMFVRSALAMTGLGLVIGICAATALTQLMRSLLFGINPLDPLTYVTVVCGLSLAALLASYLPARRATTVNPVDALRAE